MADNKSSEGKLTTLECMECGFREVFTERQFKFTDGLSCYVCNGPVQPAITRPGEKIRNRRTKKQNSIPGCDFSSGNDFTVESYFDIKGTIKGLKAIQREARKTTSELKALEVKAKEIGCKTKEAFSEGERLLVIELECEESLPRVYYKGEEVNLKTLIDFHWETKTDKPGKLSFDVQYYEPSEKGSPNKVGIGLEKERW